MMVGTSKKTKLYPVTSIAQKLPRNVHQNILGFHALSLCDTTSAFSGISKKTCWKICICIDVLTDVGRNRQSGKAEKFVCLLYVIHEDSVDDARHLLFDKAKRTLEMLPPTTDALKLHIARTFIIKQAYGSEVI